MEQSNAELEQSNTGCKIINFEKSYRYSEDVNTSNGEGEILDLQEITNREVSKHIDMWVEGNRIANVNFIEESGRIFDKYAHISDLAKYFSRAVRIQFNIGNLKENVNDFFQVLESLLKEGTSDISQLLSVCRSIIYTQYSFEVFKEYRHLKDKPTLEDIKKIVMEMNTKDITVDMLIEVYIYVDNYLKNTK